MVDFEAFSWEHLLFSIKYGLLISVFFILTMLSIKLLSAHYYKKGNAEKAGNLKEMSENMWKFIIKIGVFMESLFKKKDK